MSYIRELNIREIDNLINEVINAERVYVDEAELAGVAGVIDSFINQLEDCKDTLQNLCIYKNYL